MSAATGRALTSSQRTNLSLLSKGFASHAVLNGVQSLVRRGLVEDIGLYDYERHTKRYGAARYKVTALGLLALKGSSRAA